MLNIDRIILLMLNIDRIIWGIMVVGGVFIYTIREYNIHEYTHLFTLGEDHDSTQESVYTFD